MSSGSTPAEKADTYSLLPQGSSLAPDPRPDHWERSEASIRDCFQIHVGLSQGMSKSALKGPLTTDLRRKEMGLCASSSPTGHDLHSTSPPEQWAVSRNLLDEDKLTVCKFMFTVSGTKERELQMHKKVLD